MDYRRAKELVAQHGTPTLFLSAGRVRSACRTLARSLPGVTLYYAVKANPLPEMLQIVKSEGCRFDVSTNGEIDIVRGCGVTGAECLHTHPIKRDSDIRYALDFGIDTFIADNAAELAKLAPYRERLKVLVRLSIQNPQCLVNLSAKFGVPPQDAIGLIRAARELGLAVEGLSFHIGSQNENVLKYIEALEYCRDICTMAALEGTVLHTIDIGGGFPVDYVSPVPPVARFCQPVNEYIERYFANYRVIAEPGRYVAGAAMTLAASVIGKSVRDGVRWYYIDEGLYGSFSGKVYDHVEYPMHVPGKGERHTSTIAGPTCDSFDVVYEKVPLPELEIGDLLLFDSMGAYTTASASTFNGIPTAKVVVVR
jgi:ornithine decarboxylase